MTSLDEGSTCLSEPGFEGRDHGSHTSSRISGRISIASGLALSVPGWTQVLVGRDRTPPDLMGEWAIHDDEDPGQPTLGNYLGVPFNDAGGCAPIRRPNLSGEPRNIAAVPIQRRTRGVA